MSHLIQPVAIDGTRYCVDEQGNMRTERVFAGDAHVDSEAAATIAYPGGTGSGSYQFATSCASSVTIAVTTAPAPVDEATWGVKVNGVVYYSGAIGLRLEVDDTVVVTLTPSPCGNVIEVYGTVADTTGEAILASAITFP